MRRIMKKITVMAMALVLVVSAMSSVVGTSRVEAASPKLSATKKTIDQKKSFTLSIKNAKGTIKWSTSNKNVASIKKVSTTKYKVTGVLAGSATISVKVKSKTYKCKVTVKGLDVTSKTLNVGKSVTVSAKNLGSKIKWTTSNASVAAIKKSSSTKYKVTAKKAGTATITAKVGSKKYTCKIVVSAPKINGSRSVKVETGKQAAISLSGVTSGTAVTWSVSNSSVASLTRVSNTAYKVTGKKAGTVTVKAVVNGVAYTWTLTVTEPPKPPVQPDEPEKPEEPEKGLEDGKDDPDGDRYGDLY